MFFLGFFSPAAKIKKKMKFRSITKFNKTP